MELTEATSRKTNKRGRLSDGTPNPVDAHVGVRLRQRRHLLGMTQDQLAKALGITFQQVQKYERGANRVGASRLFDLSRVLEVPVDFFFEDMSDDTKTKAPGLLKDGAPHVSAPLERYDPSTKSETLELVRAYYRIRTPAIRKRVCDLARALAEISSDNV